MHKSNVSFAKIVATPTDTAWSQVYNAGSLFAVLSLAAKTSSDEQPLTGLGKQIINNLEAEFFTLETKDLPSIKKAVSASVVDLPEGVTLSISLAYVKDNVLYLLLYGPGKILLKRHDTIGPLLVNSGDHKSIHVASGYLANDDILLLQTEQFSQLISEKELEAALELSLPNDIAETLTPNVHKAENGGASAIIVTFKGVPSLQTAQHERAGESENDRNTDGEDEQQILSPSDAPTRTRTVVPLSERLKSSAERLHLSSLFRRKKTLLFLVLALILAGLLAGGIFMTLNNQQNKERKAAFDTVYAAAEKDYDEGTGLLNLNPVYAREDLTAAKKTIEDALPQFPKGTDEEKKLQELLGKVSTALGQTSQVKLVTVTDAKKDASPLLSSLLDTDGIMSAMDDETVYVLKSDSVVTVSNGKEKEIIKNSDDWNTTGGFGAYNGNLYILDKKEGIFKFVAGAGGYGKSSYFSDTKSDVSKAVSLAIDGSIWVLHVDGAVTKYTKGKQDSFTVKGLDQPFKNPKVIYTTTDTNGLYILDVGNNRIVQLNKDGSFKSQFVSPTFSNARAIEVNEQGKRIYILIPDKIVSITLP